MKRFILVRRISHTYHIFFCLSSVSAVCTNSYISGFYKYWSRAYFHRPLPSYHFVITLLSSEEMKIKEDMCSWYQGLDYEEGFGPVEVLFIQQKKRQLNTYVIVSAPDQSEIQKIFGEDKNLGNFFYSVTSSL